MYFLALFVVPALALATRPGCSSSRRLFAGALVLFVPIVGLLLALIVRRTSGGAVEIEPDDEPREARLTAADVHRLGELPPVLERLMTGDSTERLAALVGLSQQGDAAAVSVLRWTIEHGPSDVVLDAALTLEEIGLRSDAAAATARQALAAGITADRALSAADSVAAAVLNRIADAAIARQLATEARDHYQVALTCAPERAFEIEERIARLEIATSRPRAALDILSRLLVGRDGADQDRVVQLRDRAAFAARDFSLLSFVPCAPALAAPYRAAVQAPISQAT